MEISPYQDSDKNKKMQVEEMFDNIAPKYDFLNHSLSLGIDKLWRKKAIRMLSKFTPQSILDVASGTGDFAIAANKIKPQRVVGFDLSEQMLKVGKQKVQKLGLQNVISFQKGDSEQMPFHTASFDAITCGFGVRNFEHLEQGLSEFYRVLKNNGVAVILEFSKPKYFPFKQLYFFYFFRILPFFGKMVSKDDSAYTYLPKSVMNFPDDERFMNVLTKVGFQEVKQQRLTCGIATIYLGIK
ncbi:MAG: bifunctional demethylmenaquinone methyltransferase/2-methoxy-6-polyprenyl-1,4-benzoquinol methylase UbiE [Mangrovibacterium sp.]